MQNILIIVLIILLCLSVFYIIYQRYKISKQLKRLNEMLQCAINDNFSDKIFDETMLSAIETKFATYLLSANTSKQKLKSEKDNIKSLISDISHQTKTPLANIKLYSEILNEQELDEQGKVCVNALNAQTEKLQSLIQALVKISRLEAGIISLHPKTVNINGLISRAVQQYKYANIENKAYDLNALCDEKWTEEAVCNLIDNAVKYSKDGGKILITLSSYEMFCSINIKDSAKPIPESEQSKIFTRFYRSHDAYEKQGLGIGLFITRQIMNEQGGYVKVKATEDGNIFSLFLPKY